MPEPEIELAYHFFFLRAACAFFKALFLALVNTNFLFFFGILHLFYILSISSVNTRGAIVVLLPAYKTAPAV